jgi:hypothetical protein
MEIMKAKDSSKGHRYKKTYISDEAFADLKQALEDVLAFERGEHRGLKITRIKSSRPSKRQAKLRQLEMLRHARVPQLKR